MKKWILGSIGVAFLAPILFVAAVLYILEFEKQAALSVAASVALSAESTGAQSTGNAPSGEYTGQRGAPPTGVVTVDETETVRGFVVHESIADDVRRMLAHAESDGIVFGGWGWRDSRTQIRLRKEHCRKRSSKAATHYEIYNLPSSQCTRAHGRVGPMTARPGRSQHERGLAIDFTYNGGTIGSHRSPGYKWLNANAATYGLKNLPSEPWHWSTTGN